MRHDGGPAARQDVMPGLVARPIAGIEDKMIWYIAGGLLFLVAVLFIVAVMNMAEVCDRNEERRIPPKGGA